MVVGVGPLGRHHRRRDRACTTRPRHGQRPPDRGRPLGRALPHAADLHRSAARTPTVPHLPLLHPSERGALSILCPHGSGTRRRAVGLTRSAGRLGAVLGAACGAPLPAAGPLRAQAPARRPAGRKQGRAKARPVGSARRPCWYRPCTAALDAESVRLLQNHRRGGTPARRNRLPPRGEQDTDSDPPAQGQAAKGVGRPAARGGEGSVLIGPILWRSAGTLTECVSGGPSGPVSAPGPADPRRDRWRAQNAPVPRGRGTPSCA